MGHLFYVTLRRTCVIIETFNSSHEYEFSFNDLVFESIFIVDEIMNVLKSIRYCKSCRCLSDTMLSNNTCDRCNLSACCTLFPEDVDCCICQSTVHRTNVCVLECEHLLHSKCAFKWLKTKRKLQCPLCRTVTGVDVKHIDSEIALEDCLHENVVEYAYRKFTATYDQTATPDTIN